jgi:phospholipid transport system substrate-binding protein
MGETKMNCCEKMSRPFFIKISSAFLLFSIFSLTPFTVHSAVKNEKVEHKKQGVLSPTEVIKRYEAEVKEVVKKYHKSEKDKDKESEILEKVRMFFDIPRLARLSLGTHWKKIKPSQRKEYLGLFKKLIERSYVSQADQLIGNYKVVYEDESIKGSEAKVSSKVIKDDANVDILYEMHKRSNGWMIYNVIADSTNLIKIYRSSYNRIISKYGFSELIRRMRGKLVQKS